MAKRVSLGTALALLDESIRASAMATKAIRQSLAAVVEATEGLNGHANATKRVDTTLPKPKRKPDWVTYNELMTAGFADAFKATMLVSVNPHTAISRGMKRGWVKRIGRNEYKLTSKCLREVTELKEHNNMVANAS